MESSRYPQIPRQNRKSLQKKCTDSQACIASRKSHFPMSRACQRVFLRGLPAKDHWVGYAPGPTHSPYKCDLLRVQHSTPLCIMFGIMVSRPGKCVLTKTLQVGAQLVFGALVISQPPSLISLAVEKNSVLIKHPPYTRHLI